MRKIQFSIYYAFFFLYKNTMLWLQPNILDIWYRNSLCEDYWVFGKSDIDITILVESMTYEEGKKIARHHKWIKRFLPVIGEACFYDKKLMNVLRECINPIELKRDVRLMALLNSTTLITKEDQLIFISKFLINNILKKTFEARKKKIEYYLSVSEIKVISKDLLGIKSFIQSTAYLKDFSSYEFLCREIILKKEMSTELIQKITSQEYALLFNFLGFLNLNREFTVSDKEIIKKNLTWELWGLYSYQFFGDETISSHLRNLISSTKKILNNTDQEYIEDLAKKLNLV